jgi:adenine-specific DNA-methyltransferase
MEVQRLNYIGSKYQLVDWIVETILSRTGWPSLKTKVLGDLFAGTGIVTWNFRGLGASTVSNDTELYSFYITKAFAISNFNSKLKKIMDQLNETTGELTGFVTSNFSPVGECERMFFTVQNAQRIDWYRHQIEELRPNLTDAEYTFLVASLIISADSVSNVPAVYGMYLKNFKEKSKKVMTLRPIHNLNSKLSDKPEVYNKSVLDGGFPRMDAVYLDPPYNGRQYSKNYFPLNIIAMTPAEAARQTLHGKTGIPDDSFVSPFCQKKHVEAAFDQLFRDVPAGWVFLSYSSEGIVSKDRMLELMGQYGPANVDEMDYKRFKSFEYNDGATVTEYLFSFQKS